MKISVITATFNCEAGLNSTIESFISQTYPDKELIVIDGGSNDHTLDIIQEHEKHISKWISEPDNGIYDALNKGIALSTGEVIGFLHSGDFYSGTDILEKLAEQFKQHEPDAVYGDLQYVSQKTPKSIIRYWKSGGFYPGILQKGWMPPHPTLYMKREMYLKYGLFDLNYSIAADYDLILRVLSKPGLIIKYIPEVLIDMETGGISNGKLRNIAKKSWEDFQAMKKNGIKGAFWVLVRKNFSKLGQFLRKR